MLQKPLEGTKRHGNRNSRKKLCGCDYRRQEKKANRIANFNKILFRSEMEESR